MASRGYCQRSMFSLFPVIIVSLFTSQGWLKSTVSVPPRLCAFAFNPYPNSWKPSYTTSIKLCSTLLNITTPSAITTTVNTEQ